jgi:hypothetical protein
LDYRRRVIAAAAALCKVRNLVQTGAKHLKRRFNDRSRMTDQSGNTLQELRGVGESSEDRNFRQQNR